MATLLKIQSSLFGNNGQSSALAEQFAQQWLLQHPEGKVLSRDLVANPVPHLDLTCFQALVSAPGDRSPEQEQIVLESDRLIEEIRQADTLVLAVPMYNFSVPSVLRAYFDHIARSGVTFRYTAGGPVGLLTGKKAYVFVTRGGYYGDDHSQTRFLQQFLGFIGITDVEIIYAEGLAIDESAKLKSLADAGKRISDLLAA